MAIERAPAEAARPGRAPALAEFLRRGWLKFPFDPLLFDWIESALPAARDTLSAPRYAQWLRCGGTWFAGVNALANDASGAVDGGPPLQGAAVVFVREGLGLGSFEFDRAQVSICYPGYPKPMDGESDAAYRYRRRRDAAHVDGLRAVGPQRRRHLREHHGFLLGIPMLEANVGASPLAVWEGSHERVRAAFNEAFRDTQPAAWGDVDVTDAYHAVRQRIFEECPRVTLHAKPGEAYLVHRLALHGIAPWDKGAKAGPDGRMVIYFRPEVGGAQDWLNAA